MRAPARHRYTARAGTTPASLAQWDPVKRRFTEPTPDVVAKMNAAASGRAAPQPAMREEDAPRGGKMIRLGERCHHHATVAIQGATVASACSSPPADGKARP